MTYFWGMMRSRIRILQELDTPWEVHAGIEWFGVYSYFSYFLRSNESWSWMMLMSQKERWMLQELDTHTSCCDCWKSWTYFLLRAAWCKSRTYTCYCRKSWTCSCCGMIVGVSEELYMSLILEEWKSWHNLRNDDCWKCWNDSGMTLWLLEELEWLLRYDDCWKCLYKSWGMMSAGSAGTSPEVWLLQEELDILLKTCLRSDECCRAS